MVYYYATKTRDDRGNYLCCSMISTLEKHEKGDILTDWAGNQFEVDFCIAEEGEE